MLCWRCPDVPTRWLLNSGVAYGNVFGHRVIYHFISFRIRPPVVRTSRDDDGSSWRSAAGFNHIVVAMSLLIDAPRERRRMAVRGQMNVLRPA